MAAFSVFFMQSASFCPIRVLSSRATAALSALSLFGIAQVPSDNRIRDLLRPPWRSCSRCSARLSRGPAGFGSGLDVFRRLGGHVLIALDGTEYHRLREIH
jgi:hypothetical protein